MGFTMASSCMKHCVVCPYCLVLNGNSFVIVAATVKDSTGAKVCTQNFMCLSLKI